VETKIKIILELKEKKNNNYNKSTHLSQVLSNVDAAIDKFSIFVFKMRVRACACFFKFDLL